MSDESCCLTVWSIPRHTKRAKILCTAALSTWTLDAILLEVIVGLLLVQLSKTKSNAYGGMPVHFGELPWHLLPVWWAPSLNKAPTKWGEVLSIRTLSTVLSSL